NKLFSIIGHDLRNPFSAILGLTDLLKTNIHIYSSDEIEKITLLLSETANNSYHLLEMLLNWAKSQSNQIQVHDELFSLNELIKNSIDFSMAQQLKKNITISYDNKAYLIIKTDQNMLNTILRNLISNAIKYSHQGGTILIQHQIVNQFVEISVKDFGIGMNEQIKNRLFIDIVNKSRYGTNHESGTGIGLAICKEFVEKLGGNIGVVSEEGKGSTFYFSIPNRIS
ncbi:MAG: HAMP domain-containing sensor histidine kinase, partial [Bacteroidales bacterium]|nr:HAMP domain-containing sensor histidine kinase [Bacteroidales bacterium]